MGVIMGVLDVPEIRGAEEYDTHFRDMQTRIHCFSCGWEAVAHGEEDEHNLVAQHREEVHNLYILYYLDYSHLHQWIYIPRESGATHGWLTEITHTEVGVYLVINGERHLFPAWAEAFVLDEVPTAEVLAA